MLVVDFGIFMLMSAGSIVKSEEKKQPLEKRVSSLSTVIHELPPFSNFT